MTYWMCDKCNFVIEAPKPPDPCPGCQIKCSFSDVTCYTPDCGGQGSLDTRLVAQRAIKKEKPGKIVHFSDLVKGSTSEGKEKHIPAIELMKGRGSAGKDLVEIQVGRELPHPNTPEHYIVWIQAFGVKKDGQILDLGREVFKPVVSKPIYAFDINASDFKHLFSFSYCNVHGVWEQHLEL
jgi:superoxide reductase